MKRTALVTGACKGIGKAIAERLVEEGFFVLLLDVNQDQALSLEMEFGANNAKFYQCDISDEESVVQLFEIINQTYQSLDVVVNNAGIIKDNLIWKMSAADFDAVINVNLRGTWLMCREAAKLMREQKSGRIINISSRAWLGNPGQSNYAASKAGVISLTRVLALELGRYNVLVNAISPGLIDTPLSQALPDEVREKLIMAQPTKTMGKPEDVANAVAFLADEKLGFITGQTLYVDGGKSIGAGI